MDETKKIEWCENILQITGPAEDLARFKTKAAAHSPSCQQELGEAPGVLSFNSLVPIPAELLTADRERLREWERQEWGCEWGVCHPVISAEADQFLEYRFLTESKPPLAFLERASRSWPALGFILAYRNHLAYDHASAKAGHSCLV
jgi:hypothetical protein